MPMGDSLNLAQKRQFAPVFLVCASQRNLLPQDHVLQMQQRCHPVQSEGIKLQSLLMEINLGYEERALHRFEILLLQRCSSLSSMVETLLCESQHRVYLVPDSKLYWLHFSALHQQTPVRH